MKEQYQLRKRVTREKHKMNCPDTEETIEQKRAFVRKQISQAMDTGYVTIRNCGTIPLWAAYRCLYCGEYFNQTTAEQHFGMTRQEYFEERKECLING